MDSITLNCPVESNGYKIEDVLLKNGRLYIRAILPKELVTQKGQTDEWKVERNVQIIAYTNNGERLTFNQGSVENGEDVAEGYYRKGTYYGSVPADTTALDIYLADKNDSEAGHLADFHIDIDLSLAKHDEPETIQQ